MKDSKYKIKLFKSTILTLTVAESKKRVAFSFAFASNK